MSVFIRKVKTKSGASAIQVVYKDGRQILRIKHIGSAHNKQEELLLREIASNFIHEGQESLFEKKQAELNILALSSASQFLYQTLKECYSHLGFDALGDQVYQQLVLARLIEPASKQDTIRILDELGLKAPSNTSIHRALQTIVKNNYRQQISSLLFHFAQTSGSHNLSLLLYDVTTLYFEIQKGDDFRKPGMSKERRLEPQIVIGLLVDQTGFPLHISEFEGNTAETKTMIPVISEFCGQHNLNRSKITITADAGMLSSSNLNELENQGFNFIVGSRISKTPYQIKQHQKDYPEQELPDGQIFETTQDFFKDSRKIKRRVIYQYKYKRAQLDLRNLQKQIIKAQRVVSGVTPIKKSKFVQIKKAAKSLDLKLIREHQLRAGIKGYVTNLPALKEDLADGVPAQEIINAYHQLFQVEKSFRMSKSDLKARPIFHRKLDSIKAHLTIVFTALAIARFIENCTNISIKKFVQTLRVIRTPTLLINGVKQQVRPLIPDEVSKIVENLSQKC